jgi:hypothetical protein
MFPAGSAYNRIYKAEGDQLIAEGIYFRDEFQSALGPH